MALPEEFGGTGWLGENGTVEDAAGALIKRFGVGCYSDDLDSAHGLYCLALATELGVAVAADYAILANAYPDTAIDLLTEWEDQLGLGRSPSHYTTEDRWARIANRCTESKGNNPAVLAVLFGIICGATCYTSECDGVVHADHDRFEVAVILPLSVWGTNTWTECERLRDRVRPAHGRINLCCTHDSGGPPPRPQFRTDESLTDRDCCTPH